MDTKGIAFAIKLIAFISVLSVIAIISRIVNLSKGENISQLPQVTPIVTVVPTSVVQISTLADINAISIEIDTAVNELDTMQKELDVIDATLATGGIETLLQGTVTTETASSIFSNHFLAKLNELRAQLSADKRLTEEVRVALLDKVDAELTWFTTKKESAVSLTIPTQLKSLVTEALTRFKSMTKEVHSVYISQGFVFSLDKIAITIEKNFLPKIEIKLVALAAAGTDVAKEQALLVKAKAELNVVKKDVAATKSSTTLESAKKSYNNAKLHLQNEKQQLKDLLENLKLKIKD